MAIYKVGADGKAPKGLKAGDTVVTGGGTYKINSVNSDGSYNSSLASKTTTTSNYTGGYANNPTTSGSKGSGGSSGGGGGYNKSTINSQYSSGTTDNSLDYQAIMEAAVKAGDYKTAAMAESLRNQKIDSTGSNYAKTNQYTGWLSPDIGTQAKTAMANGASAADVQKLYNERYNKATTTKGLEQYADDELMKEMLAYIQNAQNAESEEVVDEYQENFEFTDEQPTYTGKYDSEMEALLSQILNRDSFSYDAQSDPLYQQYAEQYRQEGDRAMKNTLAEAAATAGGMNSYAITAAQQANDYYNSQLANKIPELYQLAYSMYLDEKDSMVQDMGILQSMDATNYNRYRDTMADWRDDKNFAYNLYKDAVAQGNWNKEFAYNQFINDRNFNYQTGRDTILDNRYANEWNNTLNRQNVEDQRYNQEWANTLSQQALENERWDKQWENTLSQQELENNRYNQDTARSRVMELLSLGVMPPDADLQAAGVDKAYAEAYVKGIQAEIARSSVKSSGGSSSRSSGSSSKSSSTKTTKPSLTPAQVDEYIMMGNLTPGVVEAYKYYHGVYPEGYSASSEGSTASSTSKSSSTKGGGDVPKTLSMETLLNLQTAGALLADDNGNMYWADGWSSDNFQEKLNAYKKANPFMFLNGIMN